MKYLSYSAESQIATAQDELENMHYREAAVFETPLMRTPNPLVFKSGNAHDYQIKLAMRVKKTLLE
jgi:hypothetical protein